jgi:hypothetical protein
MPLSTERESRWLAAQKQPKAGARSALVIMVGKIPGFDGALNIVYDNHGSK